MCENLTEQVLKFWGPVADGEERKKGNLCLLVDLETKEIRPVHLEERTLPGKATERVLPVNLPFDWLVWSKFYWRAKALSKGIYEAHAGKGRLTWKGDQYLDQLRRYAEGEVAL